MANKAKIKQRDRQVIIEALRIERANARRDTAKQKTRGEVSGGGKKPWRQKGTGRARQGSIRAVQWVGGGRAFGTVLENHHRKINRKMRKKALLSVLEWKKDSGLVTLDEFKYDAPSTKTFRQFIKGKDISGKVLFVYNSSEDMTNAVKSARNLPNVQMMHVDALSLHSLLNTEWLLTTPAIAEQLNLTNG